MSELRFTRALVLAVLLLLVMGAKFEAISEEELHPCETVPDYKVLDFWVGEWNVIDANGQQAGTNKIEKILDGCAVVENWNDVDGHQGKSIFYYVPVTSEWKQVWITDIGPIKEKKLIERMKDGGTRFQGVMAHKDGTSHLDRTTLTPLKDGRVRQVIEVSSDSGKTWKTTFDAFYSRVSH